jgi:uracil-DNA glycosylase family 4
VPSNVIRLTEFQRVFNSQLFRELYDGYMNDMGRRYPFIRVGQNGISEAGPDFIAAAANIVDPADTAGVERMVNELYYRALYDSSFTIPIRHKNANINTHFVTGGMWGAAPAAGPTHPVRLMIIGKMIGLDEGASRANLVGASGLELRKHFQSIGFPIHDIYVTNVIRHLHLDNSGGKLNKDWIRNCRPLLQMEIRLCRPEHILLLGAEAVEGVFTAFPQLDAGGKKLKLSFEAARATMQDLLVTTETGESRSIKTLACRHPAYVAREPQYTEDLANSVRRFVEAVGGVDINKPREKPLHLAIRNIDQLTRLVDALLSQGFSSFAVDAEWHGPYPSEPGSYIRTIQFAWATGQAAAVVLHGPGGVPSFEGGIPAAIGQLCRLLKSTEDRKVRIIGHYLNADMPWLKHAGLDLRAEFDAPPEVPGWQERGEESPWDRTRREGGFDTILSSHAIEETAEHKLEILLNKLLGMHRYDVKLQDWKKRYCSEHGLKDAELEGYGDCPDDILVGVPVGECTEFGQPVEDSYSIFDADGTFRLFLLDNGVDGRPGRLDRDRYGNPSRQAFWTTMRAAPAFGEMHMEGIAVDLSEADRLSQDYKKVRDKILEILREEINWKGSVEQPKPVEQSTDDKKRKPRAPKPVVIKPFNPNSIHHVREFMFGEGFGKRDKLTNAPIRVRPEGALSLGLTPYKTTGKKPKLWEKVIAQDETLTSDPSADKEVLSVLADKHISVAMLRDYRKISQMTKTVLRPSIEDDEDVKVLATHIIDDEEKEFDGGIFKFVMSDGRVRSQFFQIKETGRASSARPALQNWSKTLEKDYKSIFQRYFDKTGVKYTRPLRSILVARPGHVLVEADWTGAELAIAAWLSDDETMIDQVRRASLPEDHPDYFDIHSLDCYRIFPLAVPSGNITDEKLCADFKIVPNTPWSEVFGLASGSPLPAAKRSLALVGASALRHAAKMVIFGTLYGQQAESLARKIREAGFEVTVDDAQMIVQTIHTRYRKLSLFLTEASSRPARPGYMRTSYGRYRRFFQTNDRVVQGQSVARGDELRHAVPRGGRHAASP